MEKQSDDASQFRSYASDTRLLQKTDVDRKVEILKDQVETQQRNIERLTGSIWTAARALWNATGREDPLELEEQVIEQRRTIGELKRSLTYQGDLLTAKNNKIGLLQEERNAAREGHAELAEKYSQLKTDYETLGIMLATLENAKAPICCICEEAPVEMCFVLCGHAISCEACTWKLVTNDEFRCPECRKKHTKRGAIKLYFP